MSRGLWFVAGAGAGIYAVVRGRRAAEALTIDGLTDRLSGIAVGVRMFRDEVAQGRAEKETELRQRLALAPDGESAHRQITSPVTTTQSTTSQSTTSQSTTGPGTTGPVIHGQEEEGRG